MQGRLPVRWHRFLDGQSGQLVPEPHPRRLDDEHAGGQALIETVGGGTGEGLQEPELGLGWHDGDRVQERGCGGAEPGGPGEHRVPDRVRDSLRAGGERFDDEERVAGGLAVEVLGVDAVRLGELRDRPRREPDQLHPPDRPAPRQLSEENPERMGAVERVVPVAGHDQGRQRLHPAGQQPQDVQGRLVGPVHVLEDEHRRAPCAELVRQRRHHLVGHRPTLDHRLELAAGRLGDAQERPERTRREQRVAGPPEDPPRLAAGFAEPPEERCLADPGLAADQQDPPARAALDGLQAIDQHRQLGGALEQDPRRTRVST
jgi:hypothetical protein